MAEWFIKLSLSLSLSLSLPWLYNTLTLHCLCFFLLLSTMALLHSTSLYHGSILDSTYFYHFSTSYYQPTLALIVSTSLDVILLLSTMTLLYQGAPLFYLTPLDSTMALLHSIPINGAILPSTLLHNGSTSLHITLQWLYFTLYYSTIALLYSIGFSSLTIPTTASTSLSFTQRVFTSLYQGSTSFFLTLATHHTN